MQSPPRNFDSFPKRISVRSENNPTKLSILSICLCMILFLFYFYGQTSSWDLNYLYLSSQWEFWRLLSSLFIMKSGFELVFTFGLILGYLGCGSEIKKGSVRILWEIMFIGTLINIGIFIFYF